MFSPLRKIFFSLLILATSEGFSQTFSWASYVRATNSPVGATDYSQVITTGGNSTTVYANILSSGCAAGASDNSILVNSSPKYITTEADGGCGTANGFQSGLAIYCNWADYGTALSHASTQWPYVNVSIDFTGNTNGVCGPVNFSIYEINQDGSTLTFKDWVEITATNNTGAYIVPSISSGTQKCNYNMGTYVNPASPGPLKYNGSSSCTCWPDYITLGSAGSIISKINIKYYPDHTGSYWNTAPRNPALQYIVISDITTGGVGCVAIVLPVELISFTGKCSGTKKTLQWTSASETNNQYFSVEHSTDGLEFAELAKVQGKKNSRINSNYEYAFTEESPSYKYYRLKQTDLNGKISVLKTIYLNCVDKLGTINLFPNPATNQLKLEFESSDQTEFIVNVTDIAGHVVKTAKYLAMQGGNEMLLEINDLPQGLYNMVIADVYGTSRSQTLKFVKDNP